MMRFIIIVTAFTTLAQSVWAHQEKYDCDGAVLRTVLLTGTGSLI